MNRHILAARSLVSDARLIWILIALLVLVLIWFLAIGQTLFTVFVAAFCSFACGFSGWNYRKWETSQIVPNMNSTYANVLVAIGFTFWAIVSLFILSIDGLAIIRMGVALILIVVGLLIGFGDRFALSPILFIVIFAGAITGWSQTIFMDSIWDLQLDRTRPWNGLLSAASVLIGIGLMVVFYRTASRRIEWNRSWFHRSLWFSDTELSVSQGGYPKWKLARLSKRLNVSATWSPLDVCCLVVLSAVVIGFLVFAGGSMEALVPLQCICAYVLVATPVSYFAFALPISYERLWITGASDSRVETARSLVAVACYRAVFVLVMLLAGVMIQSPKQFSPMVATVSVLLIGFAVSAILVCISARWYRFWRSIPSSLFLIVIGIVNVLWIIVLAMVLENFRITNEWFVETIGTLSVAVAALLVALLCWGFCFIEAPRYVARDETLLE